MLFHYKIFFFCVVYFIEQTTEPDLELFPLTTDDPIFGTSLGYKAISLDKFISSGADKVFLIKDLTVYHKAVVTQIWVSFVNAGSIDVIFWRKGRGQKTVSDGLLKKIANFTISSAAKGEKKVKIVIFQNLLISRKYKRFYM